MKSSAVCTVLNMADSTLRKYAQDYAPFLSPGASAGAGKHREYTDHDVRVLKLVNDMKIAKQTPEDIDVTLSSLQANDWERLPALDGNSSAIIPAPAAMIEAQVDRAVMQNTIDMLREQIETIKAEHRETLEFERLQRADRDVLVKKLAEAETMLRLYEDGRLKPKA
ncbi:MAG: MerR family transcriptional regulator [Chloroflexota bacterium]